MANASQMQKCSRCNTELDHGICPVCPSTYKDFGVPDYINLQEAEIIKNVTASAKGNDEIIDKRIIEIRAEKDLILRSLHDVERMASLKDSAEIMAHILQSNASPDAIKDLIKLGKRIGELSTAVDNYFKCGGKYAKQTTTTSSNESDSDSGEQRD